MNTNRRPELISGTLCATLTVASFWCALSLALLCVPVVAGFGAEFPTPTQYVFDAALDPLSLLSWPWLLGAILFATGAMLRRRQRAEASALVTFFVAPIVPVVLLAASASALLLPFLSLAPRVK